MAKAKRKERSLKDQSESPGLFDMFVPSKRCARCKISKPFTTAYFYIYASGRSAYCKPCWLEYTKLRERNTPTSHRVNYMRRVRLAALIAYAGDPPQCKCCSERQIEFLGIDHIDGGGGKHRVSIKKSGLTTYLWLRRYEYPPGFQVLCHNCNLAKGYYGACPHQPTP